MNVLFSSDDNYSALLGVSIYSLLKNNCNEFNNINIFVLDGGISKENKSKIKSICDDFNLNIKLEFILSKSLEKILGIDIKATRALSAYTRLFAASLLDKNIDKILYLDCDGIVVDSLKELYDANIDDYYCAAVLDACPNYVNQFLDLENTQDHFNSGMLLINLQLWRDNNLEKKFLDYILSKNGDVFHNDQGVINVVCKNHILKLNPKFNLLSPFFEVGYDKVLQWYNMDKYYSKDILNEALENPVFIHLTTFINGRPWFKNATNHPLRELFDSYVIETPFREEIYTEDNRQLKGKLFSFAYKYLPYLLICNLFRLYELFIVKTGNGSI